MKRVKFIPNDFDQYLNDNYEEITILGITFSPAKVLLECDPIAYRIYCQDFIDEMEDEEEDVYLAS
jgi:hypothetical protein